MKKIITVLFLLISILGYSQVSQVLTDDNGKVILTSDGTKVLTTEQDPNNFEYTPNPEWIPVNGVADGEIWILAFDGGASNLFTITCTTSAGEWQMDIYGGADGKQLLRTYDTTSNLALSHTLIANTGKYCSTCGYYTYKIVIKPKTVGANILTISSIVQNSPYIIVNVGAKAIRNIQFENSENIVYVNTYECYNITGIRAYGFGGCVKLVQITMGKYMNYITDFMGQSIVGTFHNITTLERITMPLEATSAYIGGGLGFTKNCGLLYYISTMKKTSNTSYPFLSTGLRALTAFNQPTLRCVSFTLTGTSNADRSNIAYIEIDWANSQFIGNIDISYNNLSAVELDRIFTALPTVVVSRTITVKSNVGSATCNPTIATSKNWVVVTS